jgi:hypothetical protein
MYGFPYGAYENSFAVKYADIIKGPRSWELTASVVWWSGFLPTDPEARVRFPALPEKKVVGLEQDPLSLVSTTEELLDRKVAAPV